MRLLSGEELEVCREIFLNTDNVQKNTIWSKMLEKNGITYVLVQNLKDGNEEIKVSGCEGKGIEILCGARPDAVSYSQTGAYFKMSLDGNTTALVRVLPKITQGFYNGNNVKYGYLCGGEAIYARKFEAYPVLVALYEQTESTPKELINTCIFSASDAVGSFDIPGDTDAKYSMEAFTWDLLNTLKPLDRVYCIQSE